MQRYVITSNRGVNSQLIVCRLDTIQGATVHGQDCRTLERASVRGSEFVSLGGMDGPQH
jgi:hypothetical protein